MTTESQEAKDKHGESPIAWNGGWGTTTKPTNTGAKRKGVLTPSYVPPPDHPLAWMNASAPFEGPHIIILEQIGLFPLDIDEKERMARYLSGRNGFINEPYEWGR